MSVIERAAAFAKAKHDATGKTRKTSGEPYFVHPERVASRVKAILESLVQKRKASEADLENAVVAAYLHDVVEDCPVPLAEIETVFGKIVASLVGELTSDKKAIDAMMRDEKIEKFQAKGIYLAGKLNAMSLLARIVKLADREDNVREMAPFPEEEGKWAKDYARETRYILDHIAFKPGKEEKTLIASIRGTIQPFLSKA